jgi:hypothetical protein
MKSGSEVASSRTDHESSSNKSVRLGMELDEIAPRGTISLAIHPYVVEVCISVGKDAAARSYFDAVSGR